MKKVRRKRRIIPRLPIDVALRLGSHPITTKKGEKGYDREKSKEETQKLIEEESS